MAATMGLQLMSLGSALLLAILQTGHVNAMRNGAPLAACATMTPQHGPFMPQAGNGPYSVSINTGPYYRPSTTYEGQLVVGLVNCYTVDMTYE